MPAPECLLRPDIEVSDITGKNKSPLGVIWIIRCSCLCVPDIDSPCMFFLVID